MNADLRSWYDSQAWREVTHLPFDDPPYLAAAAYLAALAYPDNTEKRDRLIQAMRAYARIYLKQSPGLRRRDVARAMGRASRLINLRLRAGDIASQVLLERGSGGRIEAARSIREAIHRQQEDGKVLLCLYGGNWSLMKARTAKPLVDEVDTNVFRDVWMPSKSVLHIAISIRPLFRRGTSPNIEGLIAKPIWCRESIDALPLIALSLSQAGIVESKELIMLQG